MLAAARNSGQLKEIKPLLDQLTQHHRFRLSRELYEQFIVGDRAD
jgi:predicted nucleic acid-binding protein